MSDFPNKVVFKVHTVNRDVPIEVEASFKEFRTEAALISTINDKAKSLAREGFFQQFSTRVAYISPTAIQEVWWSLNESLTLKEFV